MSINFCHITPINYLEQIENYRVHLLLAHLVEENENYRNFYVDLKKRRPNTFYHLDNSCYELHRRGEPLYNPDKLIDMGKAINADSIVMSDYPREPALKTIDAAKKLIPTFKAAGFKTFFCPQSEFNNSVSLLQSFEWAINNPSIDYIGVSILAAPNGLGIEDKTTLDSDPPYIDINYRMQRYLSRWYLFTAMKDLKMLSKMNTHKRFHLLGNLDGPKEIELLKPFHKHIFSMDSSTAFHHATKGVSYDSSPTGLRNGKDESEFDFLYPKSSDEDFLNLVKSNRIFIDELAK